VKDCKYININFVISIHNEIINQTGGLSGVKDKGQLESLLEHIKNDTYYPTIQDKLTHLVFGIVKFHCFTDANKRTSIALGYIFLCLNGYYVIPTIYLLKMELIVLDVADNKISKNDLKSYISNIIPNNQFISILNIILYKYFKELFLYQKV
jgi:death-on-curing protein